MIRIEYDQAVKKAFLYFTGTHFYELVEECRTAYLQWDAEKKAWSGSAKKLLSMAQQLQKYEPVDLDPGLMAGAVTPPETKFYRTPVDVSVFKHPPIKGKGEYESYQTDSTFKAIRQNRLALFLGMGTGKTFIMVSALNHYIRTNKVSKVLCLSPVETLYNWKNEIRMFSTEAYTDDDFYVADVDNREPFKSSAKFVIMSYRTFLMLSDEAYRKEKGSRSKSYRKFPIDLSNWGDPGTRCIILDESHNIKNPTARQSKLLHMAKDEFNYRYILTGTPTPNEFGEIYNQMKFLDESIVPESHIDFLREVAVLGTRFSTTAVRYYKPAAIAQYEEKFRPYVVRIRAEDAVELPDLLFENNYNGLTGIHRDIYRSFTQFVLNAIVQKEGSLVPSKVKNRFAYISQALDNPELLKGKLLDFDEDGNYIELSASLRQLIDSFSFAKHGKLPNLQALLEKYIDEEGRKVILFDFHPKTLDSLASFFGEKYHPLLIHGQLQVDNKAVERERIIQEFKQNKDRHLLIASSMVLKTGVNLPEASRVIYFSRNYSYLDYSQSVKRAHRIGQTQSVIVNPMIFENSLDVIQDNMLVNKDLLDKAIFSKPSLSESIWKSIFNGNLDQLL